MTRTKPPRGGKVHLRFPGINGAACGAGGRYMSCDITSVGRAQSTLITCLRCQGIAGRISRAA